MSTSVLLLIAYPLLSVFLVAFLYRTIRIARLPVHLRWELAPVPKEKTRGRYGGSYLETYEWWKHPREESLAGELVYMAREVFLLKALREHNRGLWWFSFPFHWGLYLLIGGAALIGAAGLLGLVGAQGWVDALAGAWIPGVAGAGYALGGFGVLGLLARRIVVRDMRVMTSRVAYSNLALLGAVFVTGLWAALTVPGYGVRLLEFGGALLGGDAVEVPTALAVHVVVSGVVLAYLPFSQMMHFVAKYFTYHQVRWDDEPLVPGGDLEREVLELLGQRVTWAAPHIAANGSRTWVEVATKEVKR